VRLTMKPHTRRLGNYAGKPCPYCGAAMVAPPVAPRHRHHPHEASRDHVHLSRSRGGKLHPHNRIVCCRSCNGEKGDRPLHVWLKDLEAAGDPRVERVREVREMLADVARAALGAPPRISDNDGDGSSASVPAVSRVTPNGEADDESAA
jgi:hypothetical protein